MSIRRKKNRPKNGLCPLCGKKLARKDKSRGYHLKCKKFTRKIIRESIPNINILDTPIIVDYDWLS